MNYTHIFHQTVYGDLLNPLLWWNYQLKSSQFHFLGIRTFNSFVKALSIILLFDFQSFNIKLSHHVSATDDKTCTIKSVLYVVDISLKHVWYQNDKLTALFLRHIGLCHLTLGQVQLQFHQIHILLAQSFFHSIIYYSK